MAEVSLEMGFLIALASPGQAGTHTSHGRVTLFSPPSQGVWGDSPRLSLVAPDPGTEAGFSLRAGDLNGDGEDDLLIGAPHRAEEQGAVYFVTHLKDIPQGASLTMNAQGWNILGEESGLLGFALALGDLNGDGIDDAALGEPGAGPDWGGKTHIMWGEKGLGEEAPPKSHVEVSGPGKGHLSGYALASGDFAGGGLSSLAIGAPGAAGLEAEGAGAVALFQGRTTWPNTLAFEDGDLLLMGEAPGGRGSGAGSSLVLGCDLDGDGIGDLAVGAPDFGVPEGPDRGRVYILRGGAGLGGPIPLSVADARITGELPGDRLGDSLACGGDLNGDGAEELLASAPGAEAGWGLVYIMWGGSSLFGPTGGPAERSTLIHAEGPGTLPGKAMLSISGGTLIIGAPRSVTPQGGAGSGRAFAYSGG